jgi:hypothetical protein
MSNACSSGCPTPGAHRTWGECMRAKNTRVGWAASAQNLDLSREKRFQKELSDYRDARRQGVQPGGTTGRKVEEAMKLSDMTGTAYNAEKPIESLTGVSGLDKGGLE